jgi:2-hydroxychromene-2-carboxylate isomerase
MKLYYDLASPYAYLAVSRAASVLGQEPELHPVLVGAIFGYRGRGSWAHTPERAAGEAEVERRAAAYGLPPVKWPYEREFAHGEDISGVEVLAEIGASVGLDQVAEAVADPEIKRALKDATDDAWAAGVQGVPTLDTGDRMLFGDDRLEDA